MLFVSLTALLVLPEEDIVRVSVGVVKRNARVGSVCPLVHGLCVYFSVHRIYRKHSQMSDSPTYWQ